MRLIYGAALTGRPVFILDGRVDVAASRFH